MESVKVMIKPNVRAQTSLGVDFALCNSEVRLISTTKVGKSDIWDLRSNGSNVQLVMADLVLSRGIKNVPVLSHNLMHPNQLLDVIAGSESNGERYGYIRFLDVNNTTGPAYLCRLGNVDSDTARVGFEKMTSSTVDKSRFKWYINPQ